MPPRAERFENPACGPVWAAFLALAEGDKHLMLEALRDHLAVAEEERSGPAAVRQARLVAALRECAAILNHSPSVEEYRRLRSEREGLHWPPDGSIRRWAGGTWNVALKLARLDAVPDEDVLVVELGPTFAAAEATAALQQCALELKQVPALSAYLSWVRREDVRRRPGRRPRSVLVFQRLFGSYSAALVAAGLEGSPGRPGALPDGIATRSVRSYRWTDDQLGESLRAIAEMVGGPPTVQLYVHMRQGLINDAHEEGRSLALPSYSAYHHRFRVWDNALVAAGLRPRGGRGVSSVPRPVSRLGPGRRYPDEDILAAIRVCWMEIGEPFTSPRYSEWRDEQQRADEIAGRRVQRVPSYDAIWGRFGSWDAGVAAALDLSDDDDPEPGDGAPAHS